MGGQVSRYLLIAALLLSGCGVNWRPSTDKPEPPAPAAATVTDGAESALREKSRLMADVARQVADYIRSAKPEAFIDIEDFESPKNKATAAAFENLKTLQDGRLGKDKDGFIDFIRKPDGTPDFEATAKIWDETAAGFDKVAKGK
jgi:hypothetical protein